MIQRLPLTEEEVADREALMEGESLAKGVISTDLISISFPIVSGQDLKPAQDVRDLTGVMFPTHSGGNQGTGTGWKAADLLLKAVSGMATEEEEESSLVETA